MITRATRTCYLCEKEITIHVSMFNRLYYESLLKLYFWKHLRFVHKEKQVFTKWYYLPKNMCKCFLGMIFTIPYVFIWLLTWPFACLHDCIF